MDSSCAQNEFAAVKSFRFVEPAQPDGSLVLSMLNATKEGVCSLLDTFVTGEIFFSLSWFVRNF
jgi:hypothetical protein